MNETIENKVANAILQIGTEITIGKETYKVAPPTTSTVIMVSSEVSKLPKFDTKTNDIAETALAIASECKPLGNILAILILGGKRFKEGRKKRFVSIFRNLKTEGEALADKILNELSPSELHTKVVQLLSVLEISDFFLLTASLAEINLLRPTKEAVTIASGLSSSEQQKKVGQQ